MSAAYYDIQAEQGATYRLYLTVANKNGNALNLKGDASGFALLDELPEGFESRFIDSSDSSDNIKGNNSNIINNNDNKIASGGIDSFRRLVNTLSSNPISDTFAVVNFCRQ